MIDVALMLTISTLKLSGGAGFVQELKDHGAAAIRGARLKASPRSSPAP